MEWNLIEAPLLARPYGSEAYPIDRPAFHPTGGGILPCMSGAWLLLQR